MYYRENHYHPIMALRSSLSLLIQIPFFIAAYHFLSNLESIKGTSFYFINDLGKPDGIFTVNFPIIKTITLNILPIIMTVINVISGLIYSKEHEIQEKIQLVLMAAIFLVLLYNSPAALVLYWTFNNIFSLVKNIIYKTKNPKRIFYYIIAILLICACIFVLFFRSQGRSNSLFFKTLAIGISLIVLAIPFVLKFLNKLGNRYFLHLKQKKREITTVFILSSIVLWFLCGVIIPLNVISSDTSAFSYIGFNSHPLSLIFPASCICFGLFVFWPGYIFYIFGKKVKVVITFFTSVLLLYGICNTFIFFGNNGTMSQSLVFNSDLIFNYSALLTIFNALTFLVFSILSLLFFKSGSLRFLSSILIIFLLGAIFTVIWKGSTIQNEYSIYSSIMQNNKNLYTENTLFGIHPKDFHPAINFSRTGKNVIIIMLDRAIGSYIPLIFNEKPELNLAFSGFTYFPNTISFFRSTILGTPPIFGGYEYTPIGLHNRENMTMADKHDEALLLMPILFKSKNYDISVFDLPYVNYREPMNTSFFTQKGIHAEILNNKFYDTFISEFPDRKPIISVNYDDLLRRNFVFFSIVNIAPPMLRNTIYKKGTYWAVDSANTNDSIAGNVISEYANLYYLPELSTYSNENDTLTMFVNNLTHSPSFLQYPDYEIVSKIDNFGPERFNGNMTSQKHYHVNMASYLLLANWFNELKNNGVYDNTRIIIVSDHDEIVVKPQFSDELARINTFYNPVLLVKDFDATGNLKTDMEFMTTADVPLLATEGILSNPVNPFTGNPLVSEKEHGIDIYLGGSAYTRDFQGWEALEKTSSFYHVKDNIFDTKNWSKITKYY